MRIVLINIRKMPLIIRVVSFYLVGLLFIWGGVQAYAMLAPENNTFPAQVASAETTKPGNTTEPKAVDVPEISGKPLRIRVERLGIDLAIKDGVYDYSKDEWSLSKDAAHYALVTKLPNNKRGSTLIYGHNTKAVLSPMKNLIYGDIVSITTANGHVFEYSYTNDDIVPPDFTQILNDDSDTPRLTVLTCEGTLSQARRLMYFDFKGVT